MMNLVRTDRPFFLANLVSGNDITQVPTGRPYLSHKGFSEEASFLYQIFYSHQNHRWYRHIWNFSDKILPSFTPSLSYLETPSFPLGVQEADGRKSALDAKCTQYSSNRKGNEKKRSRHLQKKQCASNDNFLSAPLTTTAAAATVPQK